MDSPIFSFGFKSEVKRLFSNLTAERQQQEGRRSRRLGFAPGEQQLQARQEAGAQLEVCAGRGLRGHPVLSVHERDEEGLGERRGRAGRAHPFRADQ